MSINQIEYLTDSEEHCLWEYESDIALLDIPLKVCFPIIYKTVKRNRMDCIKHDNDMKTLLCGNKVWIHVVDLFKIGSNYQDSDIVEMQQTLDTIYIHQSVDLVVLIFNAILKCAELFPDDEDLRIKSENIVLRLLANKLPSIKEVIYNLVANSIKRKICESESRPRTKNLCLVLGMPITTEIVVEILCFGLNHPDSSVKL